MPSAHRPLPLLVLAGLLAAADGGLPPVADVLAARRAPGGAAVVVGTTDGALEAALAADGRWVVHGLAADAVACAAARSHLRGLGLYGLASIAVAPDRRRLPYAADQLGLLVADCDAGPTPEEALRCVAPGGVAYLRRGGRWTAEVKPRPAGMGEWTHPMGDAGNNSVSNDTLVGPPTTLRWLDGFGRFAHHMAQTGWPVIGSGVLVHDQRWRVNSPTKRLENRLVCRDAFSGVIRWQVAVEDTTRWMAIAGDRLLSGHRPVGVGGDAIHVYDLADGRRLGTIGRTPPARRELAVQPMAVARDGAAWVVHGKTLTCHALSDLAPRWTWTTEAHALFAPTLSDDGRSLIVAESTNGFIFTRWPAVRLAAITCLDAATGAVRWRCTEVADGWTGVMAAAEGKVFYYCTWGILSPPQELTPKAQRDTMKREVGCIDIATGALVWRKPWNDPDGTRGQSVQVGLIRAGQAWTLSPNHIIAWDLATGARMAEIGTTVTNQRCVRSKATRDWFLLGFGTWLGKDGRYVDQNITRSGCAVGTTPAYGMVYNGANGCGCFAQVRGTSALAAEPAIPALADAARVEAGAGPAEAAAGRPTLAGTPDAMELVGKGDEPTTTIRIPAISARPVVDSWVAQEDHPLPETAPVALPDGDQLVAVVDEHRLECRRGATVRWTLTADARITAPPVVHDGTVVVGAHDGWVYAVDAASGARRWRALVAPAHRRIVVYGQFESAWPVRRIAVHQGLVCASAGRHPEIDGGIHLAGLDPATGAARWRGRVARDTATAWRSVTDTTRGPKHLNWITNGGLVVTDGRLQLVGHDAVHGGGNKTPVRDEPLTIDPADPPR